MALSHPWPVLSLIERVKGENCAKNHVVTLCFYLTLEISTISKELKKIRAIT